MFLFRYIGPGCYNGKMADFVFPPHHCMKTQLEKACVDYLVTRLMSKPIDILCNAKVTDIGAAGSIGEIVNAIVVGKSR